MIFSMSVVKGFCWVPDERVSTRRFCPDGRTGASPQTPKFILKDEEAVGDVVWRVARHGVTNGRGAVFSHWHYTYGHNAPMGGVCLTIR
jgi:hypothetical protein